MKCYAYTDESGNSGLKLFGSNQDTFWTGTLIAFADVDSKYKTFHKELLDRAGANELHGAELGFGRIEKIASRLAWFIREKKLRFSFVRIFKPFLATTKMFDLVFDAGNNPAMPPHGYWVRQLRLINLLHFAQLLTEEDLNGFWDLFQKQDAARFAKLIASVLERARAAPYDARTKEILNDVLVWGSTHPDAILDPFGKGDSPNFVAFTALLRHLHSFSKDTGNIIGCFVHDQQDQFVQSFKESYEYLTKFHFEIEDPLSTLADVEQMSSFDCKMEVRLSHASFGLQIVDVCLWMAKRVIDQRKMPSGECAKLMQCIALNSWIEDYDFDSLVKQVELGTEYVQNLPVTEEGMRRGQQIIKEMEEKRQKRILEYDTEREQLN